MPSRLVRSSHALSRYSFLLLLVAAATMATACGDDSSPTEPPEPPPPPDRITETFNGTVQQGTFVAHPFTVAVAGDIELTLTSIQPLETLTLGMGIGATEDGSAENCVAFAQDNSVRQGETLLSAATSGGNYCVLVYDVGNIFPGVRVNYTVAVTHP